MPAPRIIKLTAGVAPAAKAPQPETLAVVGDLPLATVTVAGGVKKAATVAAATVAADGTSAGTQLNALIVSLRAAGIIV